MSHWNVAVCRCFGHLLCEPRTLRRLHDDKRLRSTSRRTSDQHSLWPFSIEHTHISSRILHTPHLSKKPLGLTLNALSLLICHSLLSRFNSVPLFLSCFNMPVIQNRHRWAWNRNALGLCIILNRCNLRQLAYQRCYGDSVAESCLHFDDPLNFPVPTSCSLISILGKCDRSVTMCLQAHPRSSERESW